MSSLSNCSSALFKASKFLETISDHLDPKTKLNQPDLVAPASRTQSQLSGSVLKQISDTQAVHLMQNLSKFFSGKSLKERTSYAEDCHLYILRPRQSMSSTSSFRALNFLPWESLICIRYLKGVEIETLQMYSPQVVQRMLQGAITRIMNVEFLPPALFGTWMKKEISSMRSQEGHLRRIEIWWIVLVQNFSLSHLDWLADTLKQAKLCRNAKHHLNHCRRLFVGACQKQFRQAGGTQYH